MRRIWIATTILGALIIWGRDVYYGGFGIGIGEQIAVAASGAIICGGTGWLLIFVVGGTIIQAISGDGTTIVGLGSALIVAALVGYACWWGSGGDLLIASFGGLIGFIFSGMLSGFLLSYTGISNLLNAIIERIIKFMDFLSKKS